MSLDMMVDWSRVIEWGIYGVAPLLLTGGVVTGVIQGWFNKPLQQALTKKEEQLAEKERVLAEAAKTDTSIELVKLWKDSNRQLVESNDRLQKSNDRLQRNLDQTRGELHRALGQARREINETRAVMRSLADGIERFMPLLQQIADSTKDARDLELLSQSVAQARAMNGSPQ